MVVNESKPEEIAQVKTSLSDKTAVVTGSTSGIGRETALSLGRLGADVVVHGRNTEKGREVVESVGALDNGASAEFVGADFAEISEVESFAERLSEYGAVDILVNNAGGYFRDGETVDWRGTQVSRTVAVNHLAPFTVVSDLLKSDSVINGRIVNTASEAHRGAALDTPKFESSETGWSAYCRSKLANVLFTRFLDDRTEVGVYSVHPGVVLGSGLWRSFPSVLQRGAKILSPLFDSPEEAASNLVYLGAKEDVPDGYYFKNRKPSKPSREARRDENARQLLEWSHEVTDKTYLEG
ncbi:MAG: SDR family NAD(P)-dependent oxidoreductase [Halobacteria archaeon]|nr:SDR family NAD(P)-dependent oxidoreductase [Halobacteria archaeon]